MRVSIKPIRLCNTCLLNLSERCWGYSNPRAQWQDRAACPGFENETSYALYRLWLKEPTTKTSLELRRAARANARRRPVFHLEPPQRRRRQRAASA